MSKLIPMNDYIIVEIDPNEAPTGRITLINPEADTDDIQTGVVVDPGRFYGPELPEHERLSAGETVHWYRFADSGQRITRADGKIIAHIKHERLMSKEI